MHTYSHTMATKTINLPEGAYARLHALKREGESFSEVVDRLTGKFALLELIGILDEKAAEGMRASGMPEWAVQGMTGLNRSTRENKLASVSTAVLDLTGKSPRTFEQFAKDYAGAFRA